ncbi:MAG TPA: hypothetical protein PK926_16155 [Spirochaetota bacterium]|nr:hypothetical protein [Spirochaetota bacterium]HPI90518.1 hypothetical protein [Spirochaetota bacterium]HPR47882.1 hypothetical protein [Spirochaetota bacterium]
MKARVIINHETPLAIVRALTKSGYRPVIIPPCGDVSSPIAGHPDIQVFVYGNRIYCHRNIPPEFVKQIEDCNEVIITGTRLGNDYPRDIAFNIACTGAYAIHNFPFCDCTVRSALDADGVHCIDVRQGYSRCSTVIVDHERIITADNSIYQKAASAGLHVLLIRPGHSELPGYAHGFLGGASGTRHDTVYFTGSIEDHPDGPSVISFIEASGKKAVSLYTGPLLDLGSLLFLD